MKWGTLAPENLWIHTHLSHPTVHLQGLAPQQLVGVQSCNHFHSFTGCSPLKTEHNSYKRDSKRRISEFSFNLIHNTHTSNVHFLVLVSIPWWERMLAYSWTLNRRYTIIVCIVLTTLKYLPVHLLDFQIIKFHTQGSEMAQQLSALDVLLGDLGWVPSTTFSLLLSITPALRDLILASVDTIHTHYA